MLTILAIEPEAGYAFYKDGHGKIFVTKHPVFLTTPATHEEVKHAIEREGYVAEEKEVSGKQALEGYLINWRIRTGRGKMYKAFSGRPASPNLGLKLTNTL